MSDEGLGNASMLAKIDKLRELNVGSLVPLPQLVVVGDQSSGKSSVLESLTGFSFPQDVGLCTRYATQITCARDAVESVTISIIPRPDASEGLKTKLLGFHYQLHQLSNSNLGTVFHEANLVMGIRMLSDDDTHEKSGDYDSEVSHDDDHGDCDVGTGAGAFSQDILKIEIHGPEQSHLTVIDVPGIFRNSTPGLTTETDIILVRNMVQSYMNDRRTIILAVIPCNVDIATQEILKLAQAADPEGVRTMGVLTKPDLATETATRSAVIDLVQGRRNTLKLGYYVVKNRGADDKTSSLAKRTEKETAFFMAPPWTRISERCGVTALKDRLRRLLMNISRQEFPQVKSEIEERLRRCKAELDIMGPSRGDQSTQRQYLGRLATRFQKVSFAALNALYTGEEIFKSDPELRLMTRIIKLNEVFSEVFLKRGHRQLFGDVGEDRDGSVQKNENGPDVENLPLTKYRELGSIVRTDKFECPLPSEEPIVGCVKEVYHWSRGPELTTFGGTVLSTVFQKQTEKWEKLAVSHASDAIVLVHDFIYRLLVHLCPEEAVRNQLWETLLVQELSQRYRKAMDHVRFLLKIECGSRPSTFNHYFTRTLQEKRSDRLSKPLVAHEETVEDGSSMIPAATIVRIIKDKSQEAQVCDDILDTLTSYYKIARERFVDVICQQVISYSLLEGDDSPMKVFSPEFVMGLDADQLEMVAGEDEETKEQRLTLERRARSLEEAVKVLRG
ncbi:interferon-induced GTP-binding protein Mx2 [Ophiocordyceps camponoti-floridani]|uniref:Interferon-induced GTP-binding protein Mx2 n=1 Tax=Ophiocordyceps camponoti-floridani TaxID=2030778 RepID=A0A8H4Q3P5_9HYPO|nr:interferon-induced GTP-binding protein Mx2 [Ophiocordyceps camponoti-floridani]